MASMRAQVSRLRHSAWLLLRPAPPSAVSPTAFPSFLKLVARIVLRAFITATEAWFVVGQGGPVGKSVSDDIRESLEDPEFKAEYDRLAPYEDLARIVIMRRAVLGLEAPRARAGRPSASSLTGLAFVAT